MISFRLVLASLRTDKTVRQVFWLVPLRIRLPMILLKEITVTINDPEVGLELTAAGLPGIHTRFPFKRDGEISIRTVPVQN